MPIGHYNMTILQSDLVNLYNMDPFDKDQISALHNSTKDSTMPFIVTRQAMHPLILPTSTPRPLRLKLFFHQEDAALSKLLQHRRALLSHGNFLHILRLNMACLWEEHMGYLWCTKIWLCDIM